MPMDLRLTGLLSSFVEAHGQYTLARLEFALHHPAKPAPPVVDYLAGSCEDALRGDWHQVEAQLEAALAFAVRLERFRRRKRSTDRALRLFSQSLRELDRSARAIRWMLTITESRYDI